MIDIRDRTDIELLVHTFYQKAIIDEHIGFIFTEIAELDLEAHVPIIIDFWESVLFHTGVYRRNTMQIHLHLNQKIPLQKSHFERWLALFHTTVDELFTGAKANLAKERSLSIATMMQIKIA